MFSVELDSGLAAVLKTGEDLERVSAEADVLRALASAEIAHTPRLVGDTMHRVVIDIFGREESPTWDTLLITPLGVPPPPGGVSPVDVQRLARTMACAADAKLCPVDVDPSNVILHGSQLMLIDWEGAGPEGGESQVTGKRNFLPNSVLCGRRWHDGDAVVRSLEGALESLYYCAVVWAVGDDALWATSRYREVTRVREEHCGAKACRRKLKAFQEPWKSFLLRIGQALFLDGVADRDKVVAAFSHPLRPSSAGARLSLGGKDGGLK